MKKKILNLGGNSFVLKIIGADKNFCYVRAQVGNMVYTVRTIIWNNQFVAI